MSGNAKIQMSDQLEEVVGWLRGLSGNQPSKRELEDASGPTAWPANTYHTVAEQVAPLVLKAFGELDADLAKIEALMSEAIADQQEVETGAAEALRKLLADVEGAGDFAGLGENAGRGAASSGKAAGQGNPGMVLPGSDDAI